MSVEASGETAQDTVPRWRAALLAGAPYEFTTEELLAEFNRDFATPTITARRLKSWATYGLLPPSRRRVPPGATDGIARALYPHWTVYVIAELLGEQSRGAKIAELLATTPERLARWEHDPLVDPAAARASATRVPGITSIIPRALQRSAWDYAERAARERGMAALHTIFLTMQDDDGEQVSVEIRRPPPLPHVARGGSKQTDGT